MGYLILTKIVFTTKVLLVYKLFSLNLQSKLVKVVKALK